MPVFVAVVILLLTGCSPSTEHSGSDVSAQDSTEVGGSQPDEGSLVNGIPADLSCETFAAMVPEITSGLYLNTSSNVDEERMLCSWSDVPLDSILVSSDSNSSLDVTFLVQFDEAQTVEFLQSWCVREDVNTNSIGVELFSEYERCAGGTLSDGGDLWAWIPNFELDLRISCEFSTQCTPALPPGWTDEVGFNSLLTLADALYDEDSEQTQIDTRAGFVEIALLEEYVFPDNVDFPCERIAVSSLYPNGSVGIASGGSTSMISLTEYSSCSLGLDTDGNGVVSVVEDGDGVSVTGGLLETLAGDQESDYAFLEDPAIWGSLCIGEERVNVETPRFWSAASGCRSEAGLKSLHYLVVAKTVSGEYATFSCGVNAGSVSLGGREDDAVAACTSIFGLYFQ